MPLSKLVVGVVLTILSVCTVKAQSSYLSLLDRRAETTEPSASFTTTGPRIVGMMDALPPYRKDMFDYERRMWSERRLSIANHWLPVATELDSRSIRDMMDRMQLLQHRVEVASVAAARVTSVTEEDLLRLAEGIPPEESYDGNNRRAESHDWRRQVSRARLDVISAYLEKCPEITKQGLRRLTDLLVREDANELSRRVGAAFGLEC